MRAASARLELLASPAFIAALALLVVNDFALKALFHNALTGKLSDFAGLFALALLVATLWPRHARLAGVFIAAAFTFWKTSYAEPLIDALNAVSPFLIGRTVDLTDLIALPMIPLAVLAAPRLKPLPLPRALQLCLAVVAPLAFGATSQGYTRVHATADLPASAVVDEAALQRFFDDVARQHGMSCAICDPIGEGRIYGEPYRPDLTVNFAADRGVLFFAAGDSATRAGERGRAAMEADIRAGLAERFPGVAISDIANEPDDMAESTWLKVKIANGGALSIQHVEEARRALSSIVEEVVRAHDLSADLPFYYAGRRRSWDQRDLELRANYEGNAALGVRVTYRNDAYEPAYRAVLEDLAQRLVAEFGLGNLTQETTAW